MRVVTLNVQHGGGRRTDLLARHLRAAAADIAVLTEYRRNTASRRLIEALAGELPHLYDREPPTTRSNGVAVLSRRPLLPVTDPCPIPGQEHRWVELQQPDQGIRILGVYLPGKGPTAATRQFKRDFWAALLNSARQLADHDLAIIGDLNTGSWRTDQTAATFVCADQFDALSELLVDAWRHQHGPQARDYSWYSRSANGFRIDHAFLS